MPWRRLIRTYLWFALLWTPLMSLGYVVVFGYVGEWLSSFVISLIIGEVASACCYWGSVGISVIEHVWLKRRKLTRQERPVYVYAARSALFLAPGIYLGYRAAGLTPNFAAYREGFVFAVVSSLLFIVLEMRSEAKQAAHALETAGMRAQIAALTAQMNPHLLFNALNSITSLIATRPDEAEAMTIELARLYRQALAASRQETHSLADELSFVRAFLALESRRFDGRVRHELQVPDEVDAASVRVPVLCVQPLVENALKHGLLGRAAGGNVWIRVSQEGDAIQIAVDDDGVGLGQSRQKNGAGTAVSNCRDRLRLLYGDAAKLELGARAPAGTSAVLTLPTTLSSLPSERA